MKPYRLFTIGHSTLSQEDFANRLRKVGADCVVDVRSRPEARYFPQFNEDKLAAFLREQRIYYLNFCSLFGPRHYDCLTPDGMVDFERVMQSRPFLYGVQRVMQGLRRGYRPAFMCSEADPLECHRFSLVGRYFTLQGLDVQHVLGKGRLASQRDLERDMLRLYLKKKKVRPVALLFDPCTEEQQLSEAYRVKNREIGFRTE